MSEPIEWGARIPEIQSSGDENALLAMFAHNEHAYRDGAGKCVTRATEVT